VWYPGDPENCLRLLPKHLMAKLSKETGFERAELEALWEQWTFMANTEWREDPDGLGLAMDRKTFERYLIPSGGYRHIAPNLLHDRMFAFYDDNKDDLIGFSEFLRGTAYRKRRDRLRRIFDGYDVDGDGYVNRRDFLRLFRAYYVLFRQMHKDILDGLDDQVMSSVEVEQLINSRQPLSSLFGREGGFPHIASNGRMEGKGSNEAIRAVSEDAPDVADRQSVLASVFTEQALAGDAGESLFVPSMENPRSSTERESGIEYLNGLLNPPTRINELPALLLGETRDGEDFLVVVDDGGNQDGSSDEQEGPSGDESPPIPGENGGTSGEDAGANHRETDGFSDQGDAEANERGVRRVPYKAVRSARRKLFDRWKRRQFYLDEEEGAVPPEGWSDDQDVLTTLNSPAEESKAAQHPVLSRSRSSSKVRFAEDADDFDIRSNPSTSSRSVPERWGGLEIPDAERDVGKEIFYQVMQQAFNEILDRIFKAKEDLAVKAAETKEERDKYRHLFQSIDLHEGEETKSGSGPAAKSVQEQSLQDLLRATGYSIDTSLQNEDKTGEGVADDGEHSETSAEEEDEIPPLIGDDDGPAEEVSVIEPTPHRDPTMPQFRPNSVAATYNETPPPIPPKATAEKTEVPSQRLLSRRLLMYWKRLDLAEEEAKQRGGWGRLSYAEFERIYKSEEARGKRLDYLGTWIDFCIPFN
jgi:Ca2+-binding EF-hand superfamily protein